MVSISYDKVRYRLRSDLAVLLPFYGDVEHYVKRSRLGFVELKNGEDGAYLRLKPGFSWDGASGVPDWGLLKASAVHDAGYTLMRDGILPWRFQVDFDRFFYTIAKESVPSWWAWLCWKALILFGRNALRNPRKVKRV